VKEWLVMIPDVEMEYMWSVKEWVVVIPDGWS